MTLPSYNAISFSSKEEHQAALYDACLMIVNTYNQSDMLDSMISRDASYDFMKFARNIVNQLAEEVTERFNPGKFLGDARSTYNSSSDYRYGQHLMNELFARYPQITVPEEADCFYDDKKVELFTSFLYSLNVND